MDEELREKILKILTDLPSENSWLDYKLIPYEKTKKAEFIKDICAFLNSSESYGKDKFIIFGIKDKTKYKKGINETPMEDDNEYQKLVQKIQPRPFIETGTITVEGLDFGYIHISKENTDRIYSIVEDYPPENVTRLEEEKNTKYKVYASTAYIRKGSVAYRLNEYDRRYIYQQDLQLKNSNSTIVKYIPITIDEKEKNILKICALFGSWSEKNESDKAAISEVIGEDYSVWIKTLRNLLTKKFEYITFKNGIWKIEKRNELLQKYSDSYFDSEIANFLKETINILLEKDPKFELKSDKRIMAKVVGKNSKYSKTLKTSVVESWIIIKSIKEQFYNCYEKIKTSFFYIVRKVLEEADWQLYATLDEILPYLAEISEDEYLVQLKRFIIENTVELEKLINEKEEFVTSLGYTTGIYWSLELLAWNPKYLMSVFEILYKLVSYDKNALDVMVRILLPWYPQTKADIPLRISTVEMVLNEYLDIGWKLLIKLMPNEVRNSFPTYKPKWNNIIEEKEEKTTYKELYEQYKEYIKLGIKYAKSDVQKLSDLIKLMDDIPKDLFDMIYLKLESKEIKELDEENKFIIWDTLENLITRHIKFSDSEWAVSEDVLNQLKELANILKPKNAKVYNKRLFNSSYWDLYEEKGSYDEQEKKLHIIQCEAINEILNSGIEEIIDFSKQVKDPYMIGICLAELNLSCEDEKVVLEQLNSGKVNELGRGYIRKKFMISGYEGIDKLDLQNIQEEGVVNLLIELPCNRKTWNKVKIILNSNEKEYWKNVDVRMLEEDEEYDYAIEKLLEVNRLEKVLQVINIAIYQDRNFSRKYAIEVLNKILKKQDMLRNHDIYEIKNIIKDLQDFKYDDEELFKIEWSYLPLINTDDEYRAITIEKKISAEPSVFNEILSLAYKAKNDNENKQNSNSSLAMNAYRFLNSWKLVPGTTQEGKIDKKVLNDWYDEMRKICEKSDRLEIALYCFGELLYHSGKDSDGFWIDRSVAEILNKEDADEIRNGYKTKAYNSVGVVYIDREGTAWSNLADEWENRAEVTQLKYFRFARILRELADGYKAQAEDEKNNWDM